MGYYTSYEIKIENSSLIELLRNECEDAKDAFDENGDQEEAVKWYDHEKDLKEFSLKHPKDLITLYGQGEAQGDNWLKYFLGGKMQYCPAVITFDEFDVNELK